MWIVPNVSSKKRRTDWAAQHAIAVSFCASRFAGVKFRWRFGHLQHTNGRGQNVIQRFDQVLRGDWRLCGKAGDLGQGMDARVGTSRTLGQYFFAGESSNS